MTVILSVKHFSLTLQDITTLIPIEVQKRASRAATMGGYVCNLMSGVFKREEMATKCLVGRSGRDAICPKKVEAIISKCNGSRISWSTCEL